MHFTEDVKRYEILKDSPADVDGKDPVIPQRHVLYRADRKPRVCNDQEEGCGWALEYKDKIPLRTLYNDIKGVYTCIIIYKKRFICQKCKKVYTVGNPPELNQGRKARIAAAKMLIDPTATMKSLARQGGFSEASGSRELKTMVDLLDGKSDRLPEDQHKATLVNKLREKIKTYHLEETLFYIPFLFQNQWRCLICACGANKKDRYLLNILDINELALIEAFNGRLHDKKTIKRVMCDADGSVIAFMEKDFPNAAVLIARVCMRDALGRFYQERRRQGFDISQSAYQKILPIIRNQTVATWKDRWERWRSDLDHEQSDIFAPVNYFIEAYETMIDESFAYPMKASFTELLEVIKDMRNNEFEDMRIRMLFANRSHFDKSYEKDLLDVFSHIHAPLPQMSINDFGVNISDLVAELRAERMDFNIWREDDEN